MFPLNKWPAFFWRKNLVLGKHDFWEAWAVGFFGEGGHISWSFKSTQYGRLQQFHTLLWANFSNNLNGEKLIFSTQRHFAEGCLGDALVRQCTFLLVCARWTVCSKNHPVWQRTLTCQDRRICTSSTFQFAKQKHTVYETTLYTAFKKMECHGMSIIGIIHKLKSRRVQTFWKDANFVRFLLKLMLTQSSSPACLQHLFGHRSEWCITTKPVPVLLIWSAFDQGDSYASSGNWLNNMIFFLWKMWHPERGVVFMILGGGWTTHLKDMIWLSNWIISPIFGEKISLSCHHLRSYFYSILLVFLFGRLAYFAKPYIDFPCASLTWVFWPHLKPITWTCLRCLEKYELIFPKMVV